MSNNDIYEMPAGSSIDLIEERYLIESGFVTSDKNIDVPDSNTVWSAIGNKKLTENSPIELSWTNDQGCS